MAAQLNFLQYSLAVQACFHTFLTHDFLGFIVIRFGQAFGGAVNSVRVTCTNAKHIPKLHATINIQVFYTFATIARLPAMNSFFPAPGQSAALNMGDADAAMMIAAMVAVNAIVLAAVAYALVINPVALAPVIAAIISNACAFTKNTFTPAANALMFNMKVFTFEAGLCILVANTHAPAINTNTTCMTAIAFAAIAAAFPVHASNKLKAGLQHALAANKRPGL